MYEAISKIAGTWGLLFLLVLFVAAVAYALWPSNKKTFDHARNLPLEDDGPLEDSLHENSPEDEKGEGRP
ncbi:hypothetical protein JCM17844_15270 [Iodidimonas gelatinilytica]|uniref:CcoQ/FixQ family Cbb3-type cytochrome c oxidase assembly chaperone n=2 Tax=Iodidimonas TaxID=2066486 RepID=A0A5A7MPE1_9PROT|nr:MULTISPECIES: cbb3-type cytochrome c oxidase subunit 3 [Iodidimonas]GEQ97890.1 hypothetical protein JCM17844_15270 [Iodidimonas gelatinilytica]GEQ99986.1 hypothetical protein JCM17845_06100 [Iodidimonas gelatinilytica]GER07533.1 hypothetical protein JCM17843_18430 [Kordiimonadales bacterium JCM 17843]GGO14106.1 hypothetical protein GCM10007972_20880 [Iodidimonas muriae]